MKRLARHIGIAAYWGGWPLLWLMLRRSRRSRVIIISADNNLLLEKGWLGSGEWILPGGGLHRREDERAGAVREIYEETGIQVPATELQEIVRGRVSEYGLGFNCVLFAVQLPDEPVAKPQQLELSDVVWMPLDDLRELSPLTTALLAEWKKR